MNGKLGDRTLAVASEPGHAVNRLFCITDKVGGHRFFVDTAAQVSVLPASLLDRRRREITSPLIAVNNSPIHTYGLRPLTVKFGLRRTFRWLLKIPEIKQPILGADFLTFYNLVVEVTSRCLVDMKTSLSVYGVLSLAPPTKPRAFVQSSANLKILADFAAITRRDMGESP